LATKKKAASKKQKSDGLTGVLFPIERETKNFQRFGVPDPNNELALNSVYIRKGHLPDGTEQVRVTIEAI